MKKILILLITTLFLTGCTSYIELNDLAVINAIGIEYKNNTYNFYASIVLEVDDETLKPKTSIYEIKGNSLNEIFDNGTYTKIYKKWFGIEPDLETLKAQQSK